MESWSGDRWSREFGSENIYYILEWSYKLIIYADERVPGPNHEYMDSV